MAREADAGYAGRLCSSRWGPQPWASSAGAPFRRNDFRRATRAARDRRRAAVPRTRRAPALHGCGRRSCISGSAAPTRVEGLSPSRHRLAGHDTASDRLHYPAAPLLEVLARLHVLPAPTMVRLSCRDAATPRRREARDRGLDQDEVFRSAVMVVDSLDVRIRRRRCLHHRLPRRADHRCRSRGAAIGDRPQGLAACTPC